MTLKSWRKSRRRTGHPVVARSGAEPRLSRPGRGVGAPREGSRNWAEAHRVHLRRRHLANGQGRRNLRASGRPIALPSHGSCARWARRTGRRPTDPSAGPPQALMVESPTVVDVSADRLLSRSLRVVDGSRTRDTQGYSLVLYQLSYHDLVSPRFRFPVRNTPSPTVPRRGRRAAGPTRPVACLKETPVGVEPTSNRVATGRLAVWLQRRIEDAKAMDRIVSNL